MSDRLKAKDNFFKVGLIGDNELTKSWNQAFDSYMTETMVVKDDIQSLIDWGPNVIFICSYPEIDNLVTELVPVVNGIISIKVTLNPETVAELCAKDRKVIYNPELTNATHAATDIHHPALIVAGGDKDTVDYYEQMIFNCSKIVPCKFLKLTGVETAFVKLGIDSFLATKVTFFNQLYDIVKEFGGNPTSVSRCIASDARIGINHTIVPGYDNRRGFGQSLSTGVDSLTEFAYNNNYNFTLLEEVQKINNELRGHTNVDNGQTEEEQ